MKIRMLSFFLFIPLFLSLNGCIGVNSEFKEIRDTVFSSLDVAPKRDIEVGLGRAGLTMAGGLIRFAEENDMPADIISCLDGVQVGIYKQRNKRKINPEDFRKFTSIMENKGWKYIVKVLDDSESSIIFVPDNIENGINQIIVINSNYKELVIAELSGDLEMIAASIIRNKSFDIGLAEN